MLFPLHSFETIIVFRITYLIRLINSLINRPLKPKKQTRGMLTTTCKDKTGIFVGMALDINTERTFIRVYITINDGNFCIDTQELTFKIINVTNKNCLQNTIEIEERVSTERTGKYSISLDGLITIPKPFICKHEFGREALAIPSEGVQMLSDYLLQMDNCVLGENLAYKTCKKCQRVESVEKNGESYSMTSHSQNFQYEMTHYEDTSYKMLCIILSHTALSMKKFLTEYTTRNNMKVVACGFPVAAYKYPDLLQTLQRDFWIDLDAFPCFFLTTRTEIESAADSFSRKSAKLMGFNNLLRLEIGKQNVVEVDSNVIDFCSLQDYRIFLRDPLSKVIDDLREISKRFTGKKISFISSTPQGGGVALMRHAAMRFYKLLGMDVSWYVTIPVASAYNVTKKKFHNILQNVAKGEILEDRDIEIYESWIKINSERLWNKKIFKNSDIIVLDDHQTSGFFKYIKKAKPDTKIIFRSHIQIRGEFYPHKKDIKRTWDYIFSNIKDADLFISHPIKSFVPENVERKKIVYLPPGTDPLDGLNKPMNQEVSDYYECMFYRSCMESKQKRFELSKPYIVQISRFDPSKGQKELIDMFSIVYKALKPRIQTRGDPLFDLHLVVCGHGSVDDPEGGTIFNELIEYMKEKKNDTIRNNVLIVKVPPQDQILNLILRKALVALQLSFSEGFEIKVTEAIIKNTPVVVYDSGGLPLQVFENHTGFIVPCHNINAAAEKVMYLLNNPDFKKRMCGYVELSYIYTTPFQVLGWMRLFDKVLKGEDGNEEIIYENFVEEYFSPYKSFLLPKLKRL